MSEGGPSQRWAVVALLVAWAALMAASVLIPATMAPSGDGFTRGINRVAAFLGWQAAGGVLALVCAAYATGLPKGSLRRSGFVPLIVLALQVLAIAALFAWGVIDRMIGGLLT